MSNFTSDDTSDRFSMIELDLPTDKSTKVTKTAQPVPVIPRKLENAVRDLATKEADLAKDHGFDVKDVDSGLFFEAGTELYDIGQENLKRYETEYKALPTLADAARSHAETIAKEDRKTTETNLPDWRLDAVGKLRKVVKNADGSVAFDRPAIALDENALAQLRALYPFAAERKLAEQGYMRTTEDKLIPYPADRPLPPVAGNLNSWIDSVKAPKRLRARTHRGQREVFSVHAKASRRGYVEYDTDKLLADAAKIAGDLRCELTYDADSTRIKARCVAQAPIDIPAFNGVGRVHRIGFDLATADNGSMSLQCNALLIRVRCKNASLVEHAGRKNKFRHIGSMATLKESMEGALSRAMESVEAMRGLWMRASAEYYLDSETGSVLSVEEAITRLIHNETLPTCGQTPDEALTRYMSAWRAEESPTSSMGIIMAVQRAAHESSWSTKWAQEEIETAGTMLLHQQVYTLDAPVEIEME